MFTMTILLLFISLSISSIPNPTINTNTSINGTIPITNTTINTNTSIKNTTIPIPNPTINTNTSIKNATVPIPNTIPVSTEAGRAFIRDMMDTFPILTGSKFGWETNVNDYCSFTGILCDTFGNIRGLQFDSFNLIGVIPLSIGNLSELQVIDFNNNYFYGCFPPLSGPIIICNLNYNGIDCTCSDIPNPCKSSLYYCSPLSPPFQTYSDSTTKTVSVYFYNAAITFFVLGSICLCLCLALSSGIFYFANEAPGTESTYAKSNPIVQLISDYRGEKDPAELPEEDVNPLRVSKRMKEVSDQRLWLPGEKEVLEGEDTVIYELFPVRNVEYNDAGAYHFQLVESRFYRHARGVSNDAAKQKVIKVDYIVNPRITRFFEEKKKQFVDKYGWKEARSILAWHGTTEDNVELILEESFKIEAVGSKTDAGWYGAGVYFTEYPNISLDYARGHKLLLCEILLGRSYSCQKIEVGRGLEPGYDSHLSPEGFEIVIFDARQVIPRYLVYFSKTSKTEPLKIYPVSYVPSSKKRRKMELKMSGQLRTTNYKEIQNRAKTLKEDSNTEKEKQEIKEHESSEVQIDISKDIV